VEQGDRRYCDGLSSSPDGWDSGAVCLRALRSVFFLLKVKSVHHLFDGADVLGFLFLKCLKYSSSMNSGKGAFHGSWRVLARPPNLLGLRDRRYSIADVEVPIGLLRLYFRR
jgi:hypothetical protein